MSGLAWLLAVALPVVGQAPPPGETPDGMAPLAETPLAVMPLAGTPPAETLAELARSERARLAERDGTPNAAGELMRRNLSRYFGRYLLPSRAAEVDRVVGTLERMTLAAARQLYRAAEAAARGAGAGSIDRVAVEAVLERALPAADSPWSERVFFPGLAPPARVPIETIDLEAMLDTGFVWEIAAWLAEEEIAADPEALGLTPEGARRLAEGINAYALLVLRLGGEHAREELAPYLASRHLRQAGKTIAERGAASAALGATAASGAERAATTAETADGAGAGGAFLVEVAGERGLDFRHVSSEWIARFRRYGILAPTFSGGGVSAADLDDDGWDDLVLCGGRGCRVFLNACGAFREVEGSGLEVDGEARMAVLADLDNDGRKDAFVTYARDTNRLFRGLGDGRFEDVTSASGVERRGDISGPAVAFDYDGDGRLDLYVGNFGDYLAGEHPWSATGSANGLPNRLYRNLGALRFEDVGTRAGVGDTGWAQAVSHLDLDRDGDQDLYVANDFGRNELLINQGDGTFAAAGRATGSDDAFHGMNVAFGDLNRDELADLFITNIWSRDPASGALEEANTLLLSSSAPGRPLAYRRHEGERFLAYDTGWSWGAVFLDYDNDGDDDLYVANGFTDYLTFIQYREHPELPGRLYPVNNGREPNVLFRNDDGLPSVPVAGSGAELPGVNSRGVATLDFDRDGDLDLAVSTFHARARLFRNDAPGGGSLEIELVGDPERGVPRDAIGAVVVARGDGLYAWRAVTGGEGYLSMSSPRVAIGLGDAGSVDLAVVWPGGAIERFTGVAAGGRIRIRQGAGTVERLAPPEPGCR